MARILLYGNDPILLLSRRLVLERAGSQVFATSDTEQEIGFLTAMEPDILILCQSLDMTQREEALITAREIRPQMKILVMMDAGVVYYLESHDGEEALNALDGPQALLTVVDRMLGQTSVHT
jgi:DNA-binding response OmpR family regulator